MRFKLKFETVEGIIELRSPLKIEIPRLQPWINLASTFLGLVISVVL